MLAVNGPRMVLSPLATATALSVIGLTVDGVRHLDR
jgi:hypothetical protein